MIEQEIKSKAKAKNISESIKQDLQQVADIFGGYEIDVVPSSTDFEVVLYSREHCAIITDSVLGHVWPIVSMYTLQYCNITHHLGLHEYNGGMVPAVVVCVAWKK